MLKHWAKTILGDIPKEWEAKPLRSLLMDELGGDWGDEQGQQPLKVIRSTNFTETGYLDFADVEQRFFTAEKAAKLQPFKGDILIERSGGGPTQPVGRIGIVESDLPGHGFSNFVQLLRPNPDEIVPDFLAWSLFRLHQSGIVERLQHQTTQMRNLDYRDYVRALMPRPPKSEQEAIAKGIRLVSDTVELAGQKLAAAQRLRTALMQQLFKRGIPGQHTNFKQTKIGEIPEEWDLKRGRECFQLGGYSGPEPTVTSALGDSHYLKVEDFNTDGNETVVQTAAVTFDANKNLQLQLFPPGAIVFAKRGAALLKNRVRLLGATSAVDPNLMVMTPRAGVVSTKFLFYFLCHFKLGRLCEDAGIPQLNNRDLYPKLFPVPIDDEQNEIVALLEAADDAVRTCNVEMKAVQKLKFSLLQNLVTGKVRVKMET